MTANDRKPIDVLVVEDDQHQRDALTEYLEWSKLSFETASDGLQALDVLETHEPAVVILDIRLPKLDGIEVAKRIARRDRVPVTILVSGHLDSVVEANRIPTLRFRVVEKPVDLRLIGNFIRAALNKST